MDVYAYVKFILMTESIKYPDGMEGELSRIRRYGG